jgi:hypothetical protein
MEEAPTFAVAEVQIADVRPAIEAWDQLPEDSRAEGVTQPSWLMNTLLRSAELMS